MVKLIFILVFSITIYLYLYFDRNRFAILGPEFFKIRWGWAALDEIGFDATSSLYLVSTPTPTSTSLSVKRSLECGGLLLTSIYILYFLHGNGTYPSFRETNTKKLH